MDIKRRQLLTDPGDALLLSQSSYEAFERFDQWGKLTGQAPTEFTADTLCSVPLPSYPEPEPGQRRFANVNPAAMWHPLFWLPNRVSGQYRLPDGNGGLRPESTAIRSVRIAMEVTASGLYDAESAGWVDILDTVGIDVDNPEDLIRIAEWQAGGIDDALDSLDLDSYLTLENQPDWAMTSTLAILDSLVRAQWALLADSLIEQLSEVSSPEDGSPANLADLRSETEFISFLAAQHLYAVPDEVIDPSAFWEDLEKLAKDGKYRDAASFLDGPVSDAMSWLHEVRETYWPALTELQGVSSQEQG